MADLFDIPSKVFDDALECIFAKRSVGAECTEHVDELIVDGIILRREFTEEHPCHFSDLLITVLDTLGHFRKLTLDLDLTSQDKEGQSLETCALDTLITVVETAVQELGVLLDQVVEADRHVTKSDDKITANDSILTALEDDKQKVEIALAVLLADTHELTKTKCGLSL